TGFRRWCDPWSGYRRGGAMKDIETILAAPDRSPEDRGMDGPRRVSAMIDAAGLKPDQSILELEPGKGWFTDILLRLIGPEGHLTVQQPALLDGFFGKDVSKKIKRAGRPNVTYSDAPFTEIAAGDATMDRVLWVQGPHEIWFEPKPGVSFGDPHRIFTEIRRVLKPGGLFFVVDNLAVAGTPQKAASELHRSEPKLLALMIEEAGFSLMHAEPDWIVSEVDTLDVPTFTPGIHLRTSQHMQKYRLAGK
ncbi:MAG: methyltransferase domain-containing protein, partial [Pseudomonadota bacterium]